MEQKNTEHYTPHMEAFIYPPSQSSMAYAVGECAGASADVASGLAVRTYSARPERLRELIQGNPGKRIIVIDEIQKLPV